MAKIFEIEAKWTFTRVFRIKADSIEEANETFDAFTDGEYTKYNEMMLEGDLDVEIGETFEPELAPDEDHWIDIDATQWGDEEESEDEDGRVRTWRSILT